MADLVEQTKNEPLEGLFGESVNKTDEQSTLFEQYKLCVEMADRVSARRQAANNFYLTVTTFLIGFVFAGTGTSLVDDLSGMVLAGATIAICILWARSIKSYRDLNSGKFAVITEIEKQLPLKPFATEWAVLNRGTNPSDYRPFNFIEKRIPLVFGIVMFLYLLFKLLEWIAIIPIAWKHL